MMKTTALFLLAALFVQATNAFQLLPCEECTVELTDDDTGISSIKTIFKGEAMNATVTGLAWDLAAETAANSSIMYKTFVNDQLVEEGSVEVGDGTDLPSSIQVGSLIVVNDRGEVTIRVDLMQGTATEESASRTYQSFRPGVSIIPLLVVLIMAFSTKMVSCQGGFSLRIRPVHIFLHIFFSTYRLSCLSLLQFSLVPALFKAKSIWVSRRRWRIICSMPLPTPVTPMWFCSRSFSRKYQYAMNVSHDSFAASHPPSGDENIQWSGGHDGKERWYAGVHQGHCQTRHDGSIGTNVCLLCGMLCLL